MLYRLFLFLSVLFATSAQAYEVDNLTDRYDSLKDSRDVVNEQVNHKLKSALTELNYSMKCDPNKLYDAMKNAVGGWVVGSLEEFADSSPRIQRHSPRKDNIYNQRGPVAKIRGFMLTSAGLNSSINLHGQYIGVDKLGHFFDQGSTYYDVASKEKNPEVGAKKAIRHGIQQEKGIYGLNTSGIYSYADLSVNYAGMQFWQSLSSGAKPYFQCQKNQWVMVRDFDFADYVTAAWDEGINCNTYVTEDFQNGVEKQEKALEAAPTNRGKNKKYSCPVSPNTCVELKKSYGAMASDFLGPKCLSAKATTESVKPSAQVSARELGTSFYDENVIKLKPKKSNGEKGNR